MIPVRVMQVAIHEIIDVIPVRHRRVSATRSVNMAPGMSAAGMGWRAPVRVRGVDRDDVLVNVSAMRMVEVPIVQVIHVIAVSDPQVPASRAVLVVVVLMDLAVVRIHRIPRQRFCRAAHGRARTDSIGQPPELLK